MGGDEELLVLGAPEVFGAELDEEGAPVQPLLRGDPMEPAIQHVQRQNRDEIRQVTVDLKRERRER